MQKVSVIGAGVSGQGLALLAASLGCEVFVSDIKTIPQNVKLSFSQHNIHFEEGHSQNIFLNTDLVLLSSGISPNSEVIREAQVLGVPVMGELDYVLPHIHSRFLVGVTGSNGKSTVTSLIGHMCQKIGLKVGVGGNLGTASAEFTHNFYDAVVLELSSFQLARAVNNMHSHVAIITNLAPDHLDWHGSYEAYVAAKNNILSLRGPEGWGIIQDRDYDMLRPEGNIITLSWQKNSLHNPNGHIFMSDNSAYLTLNGSSATLFDYSDTNLLGKHNLENIAMSLSALHLLGLKGFSSELLADFVPLHHRCELVRDLNGVKYIDDSKGTNTGAAITALTSITGRKIVILGGQGKGEDYALLAETVKRECDYAIILGAEAQKIIAALEGVSFLNYRHVKGMNEAVLTAHDLATEGMIVLLSPACTSWDMYPNYKARGDDFKNSVNSLSL